jgi:hypothetical protein
MRFAFRAFLSRGAEFATGRSRTSRRGWNALYLSSDDWDARVMISIKHLLMSEVMVETGSFAKETGVGERLEFGGFLRALAF